MGLGVFRSGRARGGLALSAASAARMPWPNLQGSGHSPQTRQQKLTVAPAMPWLPPGFAHAALHRPRAGCENGLMERVDLLVAFLAFGAAVLTLMAWLWASFTAAQAESLRRR